MSSKEKTSRKLANGQNIYDSEKQIDPRCSSVPALGLYTYMAIIVEQVYWYKSQVSGERL